MPAAGMRDVIDAAANATPIPDIDEVYNERRVDSNGRMQAARRLPGAIAEASDILALHPGCMQW